MNHSSRDAVIHLTIKNHHGSVEHYYHFLLGFLVPLVNWYNTHDGAAYPKILIRSCAVLDPLIHDLAIPNLVVLDKEVHRSLAAQTNWDRQPLRHIHLEGYDDELLFDANLFRNAALDIQKRLGITDLLHPFGTSGDTPTIAIIGRRPPHPYYLSSDAEIASAGSMRRSVPNLDEIAEALQPIGDVHLIYLEALPFKEQILWFMRADVIVAQHGAALASLIFCRKGTMVIEILPPETSPLTIVRLLKNSIRMFLGMNIHKSLKVYKTLFQTLSETLGLPYYFILQKNNHSPVSSKKVHHVVIEALKKQFPQHEAKQRTRIHVEDDRIGSTI
jgi:hypothetical protein